MKRARTIGGVAAWLAVVGICFPHALLTAGEVVGSDPVTNVALRDGGVLLGQVVDTQGAAKAHTPVALHAGNQELAVGRSDANGYFAFSGLRGGVYQISATEGQGTFRVWTADTAPPSAQAGALVVDGKDVVRGQCGTQGLKFCLCNPWIVGGLVAAAIAIPIAVTSGKGKPQTP